MKKPPQPLWNRDGSMFVRLTAGVKTRQSAMQHSNSNSTRQGKASYPHHVKVTAALLQIADEVNPTAAHVHNTLLSFYQGKKFRVWPYIETLAERAGMPRRNVERALKKLEDHGIIERKRTGRYTVYYLKRVAQVAQQMRQKRRIRCATNGASKELRSVGSKERGGRSEAAVAAPPPPPRCGLKPALSEDEIRAMRKRQREQDEANGRARGR